MAGLQSLVKGQRREQEEDNDDENSGRPSKSFSFFQWGRERGSFCSNEPREKAFIANNTRAKICHRRAWQYINNGVQSWRRVPEMSKGSQILFLITKYDMKVRSQVLAPGLYLNPGNCDFYCQNWLSCLQSDSCDPSGCWTNTEHRRKIPAWFLSSST